MRNRRTFRLRRIFNFLKFHLCKVITYSPFCMHIHRFARRTFDFFSQPSDMYVYRTHISRIIASPYNVQKIFPAVYFIGIFHQQFQNFKFLRRQIHFPVFNVNSSSVTIKTHIPVLDDFFGIPVISMDYTGTVIPVILAVWFASKCEKFFNKIIPDLVKFFFVPMLTLLITLPVSVIFLGPVATFGSTLISELTLGIRSFSQLLAGGIVGFTWQILVIFGMHWGFIPVYIRGGGYEISSSPAKDNVLP